MGIGPNKSNEPEPLLLVARSRSPSAARLESAFNAAVQRLGGPVRQSPAAPGPPRGESRRQASTGAAARRDERATAHTPSSRRSRFGAVHPRPASGEDHRWRKARSGEHAQRSPSRRRSGADRLPARAPECWRAASALRGASRSAAQCGERAGAAGRLASWQRARTRPSRPRAPRGDGGANESATPPAGSTMGRPPARSRPVSRRAAECDPAARGQLRRRFRVAGVGRDSGHASPRHPPRARRLGN